jgi:hypothetical protein
VFVCLHPNEPFHLELLAEVCERFIFVSRGRLAHGATLARLADNEAFGSYLGSLAGCLANMPSSASTRS